MSFQMIFKLSRILLLFLMLIPAIQSTDFSYKLDISTNYNNQSIKTYCNITTDDISRKIKLYNKDSESLEKNFNNYMNINCTNKLTNLNFKIYQDNVLIKTIKKTKLNNYTYNLNINEIKLNLDIDNLTDCKINLDGYSKSITTNKIKEYFLNYFIVQCKHNISLLEAYSPTLNYYDEFENIKKFTFNTSKTISKPYQIYFYMNDNWNISNKCILITDSTKISKTFSNDIKRYNWTLQNKVNNTIKLQCEYNISEINLIIDNRQINKEILVKKYNNTNLININISDLLYINNTVKQIENKSYSIKTETKQIIKQNNTKVIKQNQTEVIKKDIINQTNIINNTQYINNTINNETQSFWKKIINWIF